MISFGSSGAPGRLLASERRHEPGRPRRLAGGLRSGDRRHDHVSVAAVLGGAGVPEPGADRCRGRDPQVTEERADLGAALTQPLHVGHAALHLHRLVVDGRDVVVRRVQVRGDDREEDALAVGLPERRPAEARVEQASYRALDDLDAVVRGIEDGLREVVDVHHEGVPRAQRDDLAAGADARAARAVVRLRPGLDGAARPVVGGARIARGVVRVVVVVEEVPAGYVVDVAVPVVVAVAVERGDQVARVEQRVRLRVAVRHGHARIVREVVHVERAVVVAVVLCARRAASGLRGGQLGLVERDLLAQLRVVPADPGVEDRDLHVRPADGTLPGAVGRHARHLAERVAARRGVLRLKARDVGVERRLVQRRELRGVGCEPEALELLVEHVRAGGSALVVRLAGIEVGIVGRVEPDALVRVGPWEGAERGRRGKQARDQRGYGEAAGSSSNLQAPRGGGAQAFHIRTPPVPVLRRVALRARHL